MDYKDRDPEILELSREIHGLTGQIKSLVVEINKVSVFLENRARTKASITELTINPEGGVT